MKKVKQKFGGKRAVVYARYSSHNQTEQSIEGQLAKCREYALANAIDVTLEYIDRETSGTNDARPAFQRMLSDSSMGDFDTVIVYELDRFARNRHDSTVNKALLAHNGVRVVSVTQPIPDTPEGVMLEAVLEGMDEYYSKNLARAVKRGMEESAKKGKSTGGRIPLGYLVAPDKSFVVCEREAAAIREAFSMYAAGEDVKAICARMEVLGLRTRPMRSHPQGTAINATNIAKLVSNPRYVGTRKYDGENFEGAFPSIVDQETFDICQSRREKMSKRYGCRNSAAKVNYLLVGKAFCGVCGSTIVGDVGYGKQRIPYHYYACAERKHKAGRCNLRRFKQEDLESLLLSRTIDVVLTKENIMAIADYVSSEFASDTSALDALTLKQQQNEQAIENMLRAIEMGIITPSTKQRLNDLEAERLSLRASVAEERSRLHSMSNDRDQVIFYLDTFRTRIQSVLDSTLAKSPLVKQISHVNHGFKTNIITFPSKQTDASGASSPENKTATSSSIDESFDLYNSSLARSIFSELINRIYLFDNAMVVVYNYKKGTERISLDRETLGALLTGSTYPSYGGAKAINSNTRIMCFASFFAMKIDCMKIS